MNFDIGIAIVAEGFHRARVDAFEQQDLDFSFVERSLGQFQFSHG